MVLIREVMFCKPGQVKSMVEKFKLVAKAMKKAGYKGKVQIMTDISSERYWMAVFEAEAESVDSFQEMMKKTSSDPALREVMKDYHEQIQSGRREIYKIE